MVQIFIAHSSEDTWLIDPVSDALINTGITPYLAELEDPTPLPLPQKIEDAIKESEALFAILTSNVMNKPETRDIVNWELSMAKAFQKPIYVFCEKDVEVPRMVAYSTVYLRFDPISQESLDSLMDSVKEEAARVKKYADKSKAALAIIIAGLGLLFLLGAREGN